MRFDEVIGQQDVKQRLMEMVAENRLPHAIMFCGPQGSGKLPLALAFASYLLGDNGGVGNSSAVAMLRKWAHPDLHFSYPVFKPAGTSADRKVICSDFAKEWQQILASGMYFTVEQWLNLIGVENQQTIIYEAESDELIRKLMMKSSQGGYKVSVIWLPERMNATCANKILKLLEEPPQKTVFIMVSEEPHKLLDTIRSRVQRIDVKRIDDETIEQALVSKRGLEPAMAHRISRLANGSWLKALEALDAGNENRQFLDMFMMLMRLAYRRDAKGMKRWSEAVAAFGREKQKRMLLYFSNQVRENFIYNFRQPEMSYMTEEEEGFSKNFARFINEANVIEIQELFDRALRDISQNASARILFYDLALKLIVLIMRK